MVRLLDEHLVPFSPKARGLFRLSRSDLAGIFAHRIRKWSEFGRGPGVIRLLGHGGWINERALNACIKRNFGGAIAAPIELFPSYEGLADEAGACDDCLVFGLRPAYVNPEQLIPVLIDGVRPWAAGEGCGVPHLTTFLAWRDGCVASHGIIADYLARVGGYLTADASAMREIGALVRGEIGQSNGQHAHSVGRNWEAIRVGKQVAA
jgi:hypothetical protein